MRNKYVVVYCCTTLPDQIITDQLSFEDATWLCCEITAELLLEVSDLTEESYIVQPAPMKTEIVANYISKFPGPEYGNHQNYREQYIDEEEDNREYFDESVTKDLEILKRDPTWPFVPAEASPLTCGIWSKNIGR